MPMPTTRRGRYLVYRKRQKQRRRRAARSHASLGHHFLYGTGHVTRRGRILADYGMQVPKVYPREPTHYHRNLHINLLWNVRPAYKVWGIPSAISRPVGIEPHHYHPDFNWQNVFKRRVKSCPKLRHLALSPYRFNKADLPTEAFYHWPYYPSGEMSYWLRRLLGFG